MGTALQRFQAAAAHGFYTEGSYRREVGHYLLLNHREAPTSIPSCRTSSPYYA